jgi:hypothetical protein
MKNRLIGSSRPLTTCTARDRRIADAAEPHDQILDLAEPSPSPSASRSGLPTTAERCRIGGA